MPMLEKDFLAGRKTAEDIEVLGAGALRNAVVDGDVVTMVQLWPVRCRKH